MPAYESENKEDGGGKGDIDQNEARRTRPSHSHSDIEAVVGSGHSGKVEQASPGTLITGTAKIPMACKLHYLLSAVFNCSCEQRRSCSRS